MTNSWNEVAAMIIAAYSLTAAAVTGVRQHIEDGLPKVIEGTAVAQKQVHAGEEIKVRWSFIKREDCPGENGRIWNGADDMFIAEPMRASSLPASEFPKTYVIPTEIPAMAVPGPLSMSIKGYFDCKGRDRIWFELGPVRFEVMP